MQRQVGFPVRMTMSEALGFPQLSRTQAFPVLALLVFPAVSGADSPAIPLTKTGAIFAVGFLSLL